MLNPASSLPWETRDQKEMDGFVRTLIESPTSRRLLSEFRPEGLPVEVNRASQFYTSYLASDADYIVQCANHFHEAIQLLHEAMRVSDVFEQTPSQSLLVEKIQAFLARLEASSPS